MVIKSGSSFIKVNPLPEFSSWSELKPRSKIIPSTLSPSAERTLSIFLKFSFTKEILHPAASTLEKTLLSWSRAIIFTPLYLLHISRLCPPPPKVASITALPLSKLRPSIASFKRTLRCTLIFLLFIPKLFRQLLCLPGNDLFLLRPCALAPHFYPVFDSDNCRRIFQTDFFH